MIKIGIPAKYKSYLEEEEERHYLTCYFFKVGNPFKYTCIYEYKGKQIFEVWI